MSDIVKDEFAGMPDIPRHVYDEIDKGFRKYLFFETIKKGHRRYTCTACHRSFEEGELVLKDLMSAEDFALFHAKHNDEAECPLCGARAMVKNVKVCDVRRFWQTNCVAVFMANSPDDVWIRAIYADRGYCYKDWEGKVLNELRGVTKTFETAIYHLTPGRYDHWKAWSSTSPLVKEQNATEPFKWNHGLYTEHFDYKMVWVTDLEKTFLRYHGAGRYYRSQQFVRYLCHYAEHPQLEMLSRMGHDFLIHEVVMENRENVSLIDWNAKKPWDLYRLSKQEYNEWAKYRYDLDVYKIFKRINGKGRRDWERAKELEGNFYKLKDAYGFIAKARRLGVPVRELMNYINRVQQSSGGGCWQCPGITLQAAYTLWLDYINLAEGVGRGKTVSIMPKDLKAEHDALLVIKQKQDAKNARRLARKQAELRRMTEDQRIAKEIDDLKAESRQNAKRLRKQAEKAAADTKKYPAFERTYKKIAAKYEWGNGTFTICAPKTVADVIYDGMFLSHCVGKSWGAEPGWIRYLDRIRSGESFLLFLRHTDKQDEPYYILEVEPGGTVRQKRTVLDRQDKRDIDAVKAFIAEWQAAIQDCLTDKDRKAAQKSRAVRIEEYAELRRNKVEVRNGHLRGQLLADVLEADLLEVGFAPDTNTKKKAERAKRKVG